MQQWPMDVVRSYGLLLAPTLAVPPFEHGLQGPATTDGREVDLGLCRRFVRQRGAVVQEYGRRQPRCLR